MQGSRLRFVRWIHRGVALLLRLCLVAATFAFAIWLWPPDLLHTPPAGITLEHVVRFVASAAFWSAGVTSFYLVLVEPVMARSSSGHRRGARLT